MINAPADSDLPAALDELCKVVRRFALDEVAPVIGRYYEEHAFPYPLVARMGQLGLFGLCFPEDVGGQGGDFFGLCLVLEELARVDSSVAITLDAAVSLGAMPIYRFGTREQQETWLPRLCSGEALGAFGLTEPGGGSDGGATATTARREGDELVIDGGKSFITNSGTDLTAFVTVTALTGEGPGRRISSIIVPSGTPGFSVDPGYSKVGWCASDTHELHFGQCRVPAANLLGEEGRGYAQFLQILDEGRIAVAALATGLAQGCVDECLPYAKERRAFGRPIGEHQAIGFKIADMEARAHVARLAWRHAAAVHAAGRRCKREAAIAKLTATDAAMANARDATQVFGGYGFMNETPVGRFYRDAKVLEIGEGTSEVQRMLIAREPRPVVVSADGLEVTARDGVLRLEIHRPERANALSVPLLAAMVEVLRTPPDGTRVVLVCSAGSRVFSAGADLSMMGSGTGGEQASPAIATGPEGHRARGAIREAMTAILDCPLPVVARVQGTCLAGAVGLVLACDLVVCAESAEWGLPEIERGLWPFMVSVLLLRHVGIKVAMDWMSTGRRFGAAEAARAGLVTRLVADAELDAEVEALLGQLAGKAPLALAAGKAAARAVLEMPVGPALEAMQAQLSLLVASEDAAEGIAAFAERRAPAWRGR